VSAKSNRKAIMKQVIAEAAAGAFVAEATVEAIIRSLHDGLDRAGGFPTTVQRLEDILRCFDD
jgi:hypothetical protein